MPQRITPGAPRRQAGPRRAGRSNDAVMALEDLWI